MFCVVAPKCSEFLILFNIVTDTLLLCLDSAKMKPDNQTVVTCLSATILNIAHVIKDELTRWTKDDNEYRISVLSKMCLLMSSLPLDRQESSGLSLVKVLQQLLPEGSRRKPLTAHEMNTVTTSIGSIQSSVVRQNLARQFLEMVHR
ncbi:uncharacterized protein LOC128995884 [Macrosteles quadrilineatus]|nr:uncharacterized protein LOC128995884 [Macrosteles quadrilineatus]